MQKQRTEKRNVIVRRFKAEWLTNLRLTRLELLVLRDEDRDLDSDKRRRMRTEILEGLDGLEVPVRLFGDESWE